VKFAADLINEQNNKSMNKNKTLWLAMVALGLMACSEETEKEVAPIAVQTEIVSATISRHAMSM